MQSVSTLMDGELDVDEAVPEIAQLKVNAAGATNGPGREAWDAYHLIGDVMRDGAAGAPALSAGFSARFSERLAQKPTVLAPRAIRFTRKVQTHALSAVASVTAIAVVGWLAFSAPSPLRPDAPGEVAKALVAPASPPPPPVAIVQAPPAATPPQFAKVRDATSEHMHEYLLAHQGISPTTAIQGVTPYIRTVSNTGD